MESNTLPQQHIAIIGAGIVGACCAAQLSQQGVKVTILDRAMPGMAGPSRGNAAHIAASEIIPLATPGIIFRALSMLLDPRGALKVPLTQWPSLTPWLLSFLLNSGKKAHRQNIEKLGQMNQQVFNDVETLFAAAGLSKQLHRDGALYLYETPQSLRDSEKAFATRQEFGFNSERISPEQLYDLEPNLAKIFAGGYRIPQWMTVSDPKKIVTGLIDYSCRQGAQFLCEDVSHFSHHAQGVDVHYRSGQTSQFDQVVLAAGIGSQPLLKNLATPKLLTAERGYNLTYTQPGLQIERPILFGDRGVVATQLDHGLRVGGWAELGGTRRPANPRYFEVIHQIAKELFPTLQQSQHYRWMGHRPSTPDSQPIIERSSRHARIIHATGHGHLGLTQGPTTALKVAQLLAEHQ